ncbi:MAG: SEC-C metal-binding domain-containing protein [Clostridiaceae bacterium]
MSLYTQWTDMVVDYVKTKGEAAFWEDYGSVEQGIYTKVLGEKTANLKGKIEDLAKKYEADLLFFMGFLDGINDSLENPQELETMEASTEIDVVINYETLYFNMLEAKADYLYELPQWDAIFSDEKRKEIHTQWKNSKTIVNENKVGRNDPCTCGSGKKYKKCCGK